MASEKQNELKLSDWKKNVAREGAERGVTSEGKSYLVESKTTWVPFNYSPFLEQLLRLGTYLKNFTVH